MANKETRLSKETIAQVQIAGLLSREKAKGVRFVTKKGRFWRTLHYIVWFLTLGRNRHFMDRYLTTIGPVIAFPEEWLFYGDRIYKLSVLRHELKHVQQFKKLGLGNPWLGILPMGVAYLLLPLPIGFAWCRWLFEREAYLEGMKVEQEFGDHPHVEVAVNELTSGSYAWTLLPCFRGYARRWFKRKLGL